MKLNRKDISDWIIHFVHDRHPEDDMYVLADNAKETALMEGDNVDVKIPHYFDKEGIPHDLSDSISDTEYPIDEDAAAFEVLKKIVHDGFIRSGWSFRNYAPTIYGPSSAVCFTEMPLYALIDYAKERGTYSGYVGNYGIAFRKKELFAVGARPVIYGLSSTHKEVNEHHDWAKYGYRVLDPDCGLGLYEQYRYVNTNLSREKTIDWTHAALITRDGVCHSKFGESFDGEHSAGSVLEKEYGLPFQMMKREKEKANLTSKMKGVFDGHCRVSQKLQFKVEVNGRLVMLEDFLIMYKGKVYLERCGNEVIVSRTGVQIIPKS